MPDRGASIQLAFTDPGATLGLTTHHWQERLSGGSVGSCGAIAVIADATIYYRSDLTRSLRSAGVSPRSQGAADLIAAAVAAWHDDAPHYLEGDFAYIAWRQDTGKGHAARDPIGTRPLFFCKASPGFAVASSPAALVAAGFARPTLNYEWLAELCSGIVSVGNETAFADIAALRQGERLILEAGGAPTVEQWWGPPSFTEKGTSSQSFTDAAMELRYLLVDAVRERLGADGPTYVSLSGGRDSSAVYAAGRNVAGDRVASVSLSYPVGDVGRENEVIEEVLVQCGGSPTWIDTESISLLSDLTLRAPTRPDAFTHPYEALTRALAATVAGNGGRVLLNGLGGDTLFHAEYSFLADLLFSGRWRAFVREWRALRGSADPRWLFRWGILPRLGPQARAFVAALRGGRPVRDMWDAEPAPWVSRRYLANASERAWREPVREMRGGAADRERLLMILGPFAGRVIPEYSRVALELGVEQRSPLYDLRLVRFAATRPRLERQKGNGDYKRLLRSSMEGWLPTSITGLRRIPSGLTGGYFISSSRREIPQLIAGYGLNLISDETGLIIASGYRESVSRFARTGESTHLAPLVFTAHVESWLRGLDLMAHPVGTR